MPNIVITEGLDTPWTLDNTESNITAATDLTSINLANQTVGTLAYTASQLFSSLKTEKNNLDNIVDAIELINEEIALYPGRIDKWDGISDTFEKTDLSAIPSPTSFRIIGETDSARNTDLSKAEPYPIEVTVSGSITQSPAIVTVNQAYIKAVTTLIDTKPLLDSVGYSPSIESRSYLTLLPTDPLFTGTGLWVVPNRVIVNPVGPISTSAYDLIVRTNEIGEPTSFTIYAANNQPYDLPLTNAFP
jgi:hypothetical protein